MTRSQLGRLDAVESRYSRDRTGSWTEGQRDRLAGAGGAPPNHSGRARSICAASCSKRPRMGGHDQPDQAVSFVSVTQQFNTTSSMGRLTLNVLLSFAQFEREVT